MEGEVSAMETLLTNLGTIITQMFTWLGNVIDIVVEKPLLFLGFGVGLAFTIVKLFKRF